MHKDLKDDHHKVHRSAVTKHPGQIKVQQWSGKRKNGEGKLCG